MVRFIPYTQKELQPEMSAWDVVLLYVRKYRNPLILLLVFVFLWEAFLTSSSFMIKKIIDVLTQIQSGNSTINNAYVFVSGLGIIMLLGNFSYRMTGQIGLRYFPFIRRDIRVDFFSYLHKHSHRYFSNHFWWALTNKITTAGRALDDIIGMLSWDLIPAVINITISLTFLSIANWSIWVVTFSIIVLYFSIFYPFLKKFRGLSRVSSDASSFSSGKIADVITNIWNLQSHARSEFEEKYLSNVFDKEVSARQDSWMYMELIRVAQNLVIVVFITCMSLFALSLWSKWSLSYWSVVLVLMISMNILLTVRNFAQRFVDFSEKRWELEDVISTILLPYEISPITQKLLPSPIENGNIELKNITFAYDERWNVFENLSLTIPHGQKVGFVGVSGSGKSTLVLLLQRFYELQGGQITIWSHDITKISQEELRSSIAVVPQDPVLFHRSLFENISYGADEPSEEKVLEAARLAHAHEFIDSLPEKYEAKVGERGVKLSGGQRQRIAIARAILKNAPILLLDEATSALDSESEELIQDALEHVMEGKTVIAIAHRLSTLKNMDRIIVLEKGKIIEDGSHDELIAKDGTYAYLYKKQVSGFMTE